MDSSVKRWVSYGGLVFFVILAVAVFIAPMEPSSNATAAKVTSFYHQHRAVYIVNAYVIVLAVIIGLPYFWYLREYLGRVQANRRLLTVAFSGAIVFALSGLVSAGLKFALADASHAGNITGTSMQTMNVLENDLNVPMAAAGTATFLIVTGLVVIRNGGLPRWLGWVAVVLGVISAAGFVGPAGAGLWVLITSITLIVSRSAGLASADATSDTATPVQAP